MRGLGKALIIEPFLPILFIPNYVAPKCPATYPPISPLLRLGLISSSAILHMPLQIASSGSPVVSLSASVVTSIGDYYKPDRLCAANTANSKNFLLDYITML
jgi:hypothetical protein